MEDQQSNLIYGVGAVVDTSFEVLGKDGDRAFFRTWHANADGTQSSVLAAWSTGEPPTAASLDRLSHEYGLKDQLDGTWAVRPLELVRQGDRTVLVFEDPGGEPLERLLGAPFAMARFLRLALSIAAALGEVHLRGLVHKDLKPAHILVDESTGSVRLTGFGLATLLPRERQSPAPPETIAGTLAYMAPEQTGRMNRSIDARSDLYSLGVTFYQMLTGSLPFTASEPMEWIHCHIARRPVPPSERVERVPAQVSRIVMKLLAKTAEERYQTAVGLAHDLRHCLTEWEAVHRINPFQLGERDIPDQLLIPEKLYGREREIAALLSTFDRVVKEGTPGLVLVSGYSGIGKSSVVNELHKVLVPSRGLFASGKFDQYKRNIPYATLAQAFQSLVSQILGKSDTEMGQWRAALQEALGPNGQLMTTLVPALALIIGEPPPPPDLPLQDQQARFQMVFRRFLSVFARPEHPLTLFLDDLQWLDSATLDLIEHLIAHPDVRHLLLVGAYRDNEVGPAHPLARTLARLRGAGGGVREIVLAPLCPEDMARLVADALHMDSGRVRPLADLIFEKTAGNPFFTIQFLLALAEQALLIFDPGIAAWTWDLPRIRVKGFTDNVADLMAAKLSRLPRATQNVLGQLACLGNVAKAGTLAALRAEPEETTNAALWDAVRSGLVLCSDGTCTFLHDRIREAAYALIPEGERAMVHLRIGRVLAAGTPEEDLDDNIFDIVNQFGRGAVLISTWEERKQVAHLNFMAGKRAKAATAYDAALQYFTAGRGLLSETGWEQCYRLTFDLELNWAECEYLIGELAAAEERLAVLLNRAQTMVDAAAVTCLRINLYTTLSQSDSAVEVGLEYLRRVGGQWSPHPTEQGVRQAYQQLRQQLGAGSIEALLDLPLMRDPERCATMDVLTVLTSPALFTDLNLFRLVVSQMATLSREHGNCDGSCLAYAWLGGVLGTYFGEYQAGFRFARLGLDLVEKHGLDRFRARVYLVFAVHVAHWTQPLQTSRAFLRRAFEEALTAGDLSYAAYSCIDVITNRLATGDSLSEVEREAEHGLEFARKVRFPQVSDTIIGQLRLIRMLRGLTPEFNSFNDAEFDERRFEQHLESDPQLAIAASFYWIRRLQASVFANDAASAIAAVSKAAPLLWTVPTQFEWAEYHYYGALARAAHCDFTSAAEHRQHMQALAAHHRQLAVWAKHCPATFANRAALVGAEIARLEGRNLDAIRLYEEAIKLAREHGFIHDEALAQEHAARFCTARGFPTMAEAYLRNARHRYLSWGADGKVRQLDQRYPQLTRQEVAPGPTSTIRAPVEQLDLATVLKVSQAVSGEIMLDKLLDTLMRTAIEHAGGERGLLILSHGTEQRIAAEAITRGDTIVVRLRDKPLTATALSEAIVQTVLRTQEAMILDDAAADPAFAADPYIRQRQARSILCLPLVNRSKLVGMLYLENNLAPRVFTPTRISVLRLVASQAAISLENALLYTDLQRENSERKLAEEELRERESRIRRLVESNIIGLFFWNVAGMVTDANDEFLRIVGYSREDLLSGDVGWADMTPPEYRAADAHALEILRQGGTCQPREKEYIRKDGRRIPVLINAVLLEGSQENGVAYVLDLTERKKAEAELATRRVEAKRAQEQLLALQAELAHATRVTTLGELSASIAHEVGQPLGAIVTSAEACLRWLGHRTPQSEEVRACVEHIIADGRRASEIVRRIRSLTNRAAPQKTRLELNDVVNDVVFLVQREVLNHRVSLRLKLASELPPVLGDRVQLQQVLINLVMNGMQAMADIGDELRELLIESRLDEEGHVVVAVQDSGTGIDPEHANRLFGAFFTTKPNGMGMGLSICRSIIEAHAGRLWASNNAGHGATFQFSLPSIGESAS
jgi:PAS domain S-box-containing protein